MSTRSIYTVFVVLAILTILSAGTFATEPVVCDSVNEEYQCGSACQTTCSNKGQPCPIINIKCNDACYCKDGYARETDDNSMCIPINECPE